MKSFQIRLLQDSFSELMPDADKLADLLYARFFQLDPLVRGIFPNDLRNQKLELLRAFVRLTQCLDIPAERCRLMELCGRRHARLGINAQHYETFAEALLWTLETDLGEDFTPELREAWRTFYDEMAHVMLAQEAVKRRQEPFLEITEIVSPQNPL